MARLTTATAADCVRDANGRLAYLDQIDLEAGASSPVRQALRREAHTRLDECEPYLLTRATRLRRLAQRRSPPSSL